MSTAGQNTVTGISLQADISLLYLLEHYQRDDFAAILLESKDWEDFALKFKDRTESFEVKWHKDPLSYADVKAIIKKEVEKQNGEDYQFKIVAKHFSPQFVKDIEYVKRILP